MRQILHIVSLICLCITLSLSASAQKVGLVLSGGGAKGLTHIGIIRALEENNIPIDYITGTSMGAIVGSLYAMGYSPDDMEKLLKSDDFKRWYSGNIEEKYIYYFKKNPPTPEFINIRVSLKCCESVANEYRLSGDIRTSHGFMSSRLQPTLCTLSLRSVRRVQQTPAHFF